MIQEGSKILAIEFIVVAQGGPDRAAARSGIQDTVGREEVLRWSSSSSFSLSRQHSAEAQHKFGAVHPSPRHEWGSAQHVLVQAPSFRSARLGAGLPAMGKSAGDDMASALLIGAGASTEASSHRVNDLATDNKTSVRRRVIM